MFLRSHVSLQADHSMQLLTADGKQTIAFDTSNDDAYGAAVDSAGRVIVAGLFNSIRSTFCHRPPHRRHDDGVRPSQRRLRAALAGHIVDRPLQQPSHFSGSPDQAFTLIRTGGGSVSFTATVSVQNGGTVVTLDHFTGPETEFGSLADGRYTLTALASQISAGGQALDGDADGTPAAILSSATRRASSASSAT